MTIPPPLNGDKTHPLSEHAWGVLAQLKRGPVPKVSINAGVSNRFLREELAEFVNLPSPFTSHKGRNTPFMQITDAGLARLAEKDQTDAVR